MKVTHTIELDNEDILEAIKVYLGKNGIDVVKNTLHIKLGYIKKTGHSAIISLSENKDSNTLDTYPPNVRTTHNAFGENTVIKGVTLKDEVVEYDTPEDTEDLSSLSSDTLSDETEQEDSQVDENEEDTEEVVEDSSLAKKSLWDE